MKPLCIGVCIVLAMFYKIVNCDPRETVSALINYKIEKSFISSLNQTVIVVLDSSDEEKSIVYLSQPSGPHMRTIDITQYFKGHVNDVLISPQKELGIFTETGMQHIVVIHESPNIVPKVFELDFVPSNVSFPENNNHGNFFVIYDEVKRNLHFTQSGGRKFQLLTDNVMSFVWQYDDGKNYLLVERRTSPEDPSSSLEYIELTPLFNKVMKLTTLADQVRDFTVNGHFVMVCRPNMTLLYYKRQQFIRTVFYPVFRIHNIHLVDTEQNSIKIIAENDQESRFYIANYNANSRSIIRFELSLLNIEKDYLTKINSADGVYIATQNHELNSVITFDNGRTWNPLQLSVANHKIFSSKSIPGVIAVQIDRHLMISQNGGKTWHPNADNSYSYLFNRNLGILVGLTLDTPGTMFKYSTTYGLNWSTMTIYKKPLKTHIVYSKDDSMEFYTVAYDAEHNNYFVRIDFKPVFTKPCDVFDYSMFSTNTCILGQKVTYRRRNGSCYPEENTTKNVEVCDCNLGDYECDLNFVRTNMSLACRQEPGKTIVESTKCRSGELFNKTTGYRKIESSVCTENYKSSYTAEIVVCPYTKVDYLLAKTGNTLKLYDENKHEMKSLQYYGYNSRESYEFDLFDALMFESNHTMIKQHSVNKNTHSKILVHELATIHNLNYDWISGWLFYIVKLPLTIRAFPVKLTNITHSKLLIHSGAVTKVTSLTVHTLHKYLYWRDGNNFKYAILEYTEDYSDIVKVSKPETILHGYSIGSDLVIDYISDQLYFYSTQKGCIMYCNLFGLHCGTMLKTYSDNRDLAPTNAYQIAISHMYIYFYNPDQQTIQYWDRSKGYTDTDLQGQQLYEHKIQDVTEMKCVSKSIQMYTKCLARHTNSALCLDVLNLNNISSIVPNTILTEVACPESKHCDGLFDCFYGEDEEYCVKGPEEVVKVVNHKIYWIGTVMSLGVISFMVASLILYKRTRSKFIGAQYSVVDNRVLLKEDLLEDDESDIEMLFN